MSQKSTYNREDGETICAALAEGRSLLSICEAMGIAYSTAHRWEVEIPEHAANSMRARAIGCHHLAEECVEIADNGRNDWMERRSADDPDAGWVLNGEHIQRSRLRIETRMRLIGKWLPKIYGDKVQAEVSGPDGGPVQHAAVSLSDDQLAAIAAKGGAK